MIGFDCLSMQRYKLLLVYANFLTTFLVKNKKKISAKYVKHINRTTELTDNQYVIQKK